MSSGEPLDRFFATYLNLAIGVICAWLILHIAIEIAEYRYELVRSPAWLGSERRELGNQAITRAATMAVVFAVLFFSVSAVAVALLTQNMNWRAEAIIIGLSRSKFLYSLIYKSRNELSLRPKAEQIRFMFYSSVSGAVIIFFISYKTPKWIGVYWSNKHDYGAPVGTSVFQLKFNVSWSIWRHFGQVYFISLLFFCGVNLIKISLSALFGLSAGFMIYHFVYLGRTKFSDKKEKVASIMAAFISIGSAVAFSSGCCYIQLVWGDQERSVIVGIASFFCWLVLEGVLHLAMYRNTLRKKEAALQPDERFARKSKTQHLYPEQMKGLSQIEDEARAKYAQEKRSDACDGEFEHSDQASGGDVDKEDQARNDCLQQENALDTTNEESAAPKQKNGDLEVPARTDANYEEGLEEQNESWCILTRLHCCDNAERYGERQEKTTVEKLISVIKWISLILVNALFLYLVIVNIGATHQNKVVQRHLQDSFEFLYPPDYNNGTVCAWDNQGEESSITTFDSPAAAAAANFSVVHCGACGACSNWNDLSNQWTTRTHLAKDAQDCTKKSLLGGEEAVQECNRDGIGFTEDCAWCWTADALCAKKNCVFIFLQVSPIC